MEKETPKKSSSLKMVLYVIIGLILLTLGLEAMNVDVVGTSESETVIERPHRAD